MLKKYILENPEFIKHFRIAFRKQKLLSLQINANSIDFFIETSSDG